MNEQHEHDQSGRWPRWPAVIAVSVLLAGLLVGAFVYLRASVGGLDVVAVCSDDGRQQRVPDQACQSGQSGRAWVFYRVDTLAPAIGQSTAGAIDSANTPERGRRAVGGIPTQGGPVHFPDDR